MTVSELKKILVDLPDDMIVGGCGHFGELLELFSAEVTQVYISALSKETQTILYINIEGAGEDPD